MQRVPATWETGAVGLGGGQQLGYLRTGRGPVVVLIHDWPQSSWAWRHVIARLRPSHRVIAVDLPGTGTSTPYRAGFDKRTLAETVATGLRGLGAGDEPVAVVGHGIGAMVGYAFARLFPAWTRRLVVVDQPLPGVPGWEEMITAPAWWHAGFHRDTEDGVGLAETLVGGREAAYFRHHIDRFAAHRGAVTSTDLAEYVDAYRSDDRLRAGFEMFRALPRDVADNTADRAVTGVPVTLAFAQYSQASLLPTVRDGLARRGFAAVRTVVVSNSGHWVAEEQPAALADLVASPDERAW